MGYTTKAIVSVVLGVALLSGTSGCSLLPHPIAPAVVEEDLQAENEQALADYVQGERDTLPQVLADNPGLYTDATVEGAFVESTGDDDLAAGTYALVTFSYQYADTYDWPTVTGLLDDQRETLDSACNASVFGAMRKSGITGPLAVEFTYRNGGDADETWSHTCSE